VENRRAILVHAFDIAGAKMREASPTARIRNHDLAGVEVSGEDQVEHTREPSGDPREVTEEDAQIGSGVREVLRMSTLIGVRPGIDSDDLDAPSAKLQLDRLVGEERHTLEGVDRSWIDVLGKRVAAVGEVVVSEHDVAAIDVGEKALELAHA